MKSHRSFVPALAGVLVAFGVTAAPAPATAQLTGHVKSVDTDANKLIVTETGTGTDYTIAVDGQTLVVTTAGKPLTLKDLRKGDGLAVTQLGGVASKIVAEQAPLVGVVKSVDAEAKKLVLRETRAKGEAGASKDITMTVDDQTAITTTDGKAIQLGDLKEGDSVSITPAGDLAQKIEVNVKPDELTGFVKSVGADLKTFVVTLTGTTKDVTVVVNDQTKIVTTEGKTLKIKDLKEGDGVGIAHTASVAKKMVVNVKPPR
jgi:Cu/Ag efflux protein CusF